jgi:CheY-like chemotaxis protein
MKKSLLIVDDDEVMVLLLKKLFEKKYAVFTASDGVEAMHWLYKGIVPNLVISDLMMENITGYEFIKHLLTSMLYKMTPIIIVSSIPSNELTKEFPTVEVINKPFDPIVLKNLVDANILKFTNPEVSCNN